jgi:hypothetical protein
MDAEQPVCSSCGVQYEPEHPRQRVCRVCTMPRCGVCRVFVTGPRSYCSSRCRQRARAGSLYVVLHRDSYRCYGCGFEADEDVPAQLRTMRVETWSSNPKHARYGNSFTMCANCTSPPPDTIPMDWVFRIDNRNHLFGLDRDTPLGPATRTAVRVAARRRKKRR